MLYQPTVYSVNAQDDLYPLLLQLGVPRSVRQICHKLAELGWLFRKVRAFIEGKKIEKTAGLVVQVGGGRGQSKRHLIVRTVVLETRNRGRIDGSRG